MCDSRLQVVQALLKWDDEYDILDSDDVLDDDDDVLDGDDDVLDGDNDDDDVKALLLLCRVYFVATVLLVEKMMDNDDNVDDKR